MELPETYEQVRKAIVAFTLKYIPKSSAEEEPAEFPPIIGTGFVVDADGIIATNDHIVRAFSKLLRPSKTPKDDWCVVAWLFHNTDKGVMQVPLSVIAVSGFATFDPGKVYYGPPKPDVAFVLVKARLLPVVHVSVDPPVKDGERVATAGFPMGTDALTAPGWLHQIAPMLQEGIVSAVLPFPCPTPHGYAINVMTQGGASGSPVFRPNDGGVIGVLNAGLIDPTYTERGDRLMSPTNISYVVPSHYLANALKTIKANPQFTPPSDAKTIDEIVATMPCVNKFDPSLTPSPIDNPLP